MNIMGFGLPGWLVVALFLLDDMALSSSYWSEYASNIALFNNYCKVKNNYMSGPISLNLSRISVWLYGIFYKNSCMSTLIIIVIRKHFLIFLVFLVKCNLNNCLFASFTSC